MSVVFQHPERLWLAVAVAAIALLLLFLGYRRSPLRGFRRIAAFACKAGAWGLLLLLLLDPVWSRTQPKVGENEIVILADNSASLDLKERLGQPSRAEQMRKALAQPGGEYPEWMEGLAQLFRVKPRHVDERLRSVTDFSGLDFSGRKSDLVRALNTLRNGSPGSRLAAIILISDGNPTDGEAWSKSPGAPVFTVLVGDTAPQPDLALVDHTVSQTVFEDAPITITARIRGTGLKDSDIAVSVIDEQGKAVASEKLRLTSDDESATVRLRVPATKPGVSFFRVAVMEAALTAKVAGDEWKTLGKEATTKNNERQLVVDRGAGPYRVLYVSGRPNWEYKFLRRALAADLEVQLPTLIRIAKREPKFEWRGRTGETSNPLFRGFGQQGEAQRYDQPVLTRLGMRDGKELSDGFPKTAEDLFAEYRAIILDDLEAAFFTQEQMQLIERFVSERGGALLMLGGQESMQGGGYEHTPIGRMLPVYLDRAAQAAPVANGRFDLTREGWLEPWTRLRTSREEDEQRLAQMPGFYAVNQLFSIKPGASILGTISTEDQTYPALVGQRFGEGRVAALAIADLWRWGLSDQAAMKDLERSWRQLVRWLVVDVPDRLQVSATPEGDKVKLTVRVRDRAFQPQDDATVKIEVTPVVYPAQKSAEVATLHAEPSLKEPGAFEAEFFPRDALAYRASAIVEQSVAEDGLQKEPLRTKTTGWANDLVAQEFASLAPGRKWMEQVAADTGGRFLTLADLPRLPELLKDIRTPIEETITTPLWHAPWFFLVLIGLLVAEWWLRRKGGMA